MRYYYRCVGCLEPVALDTKLAMSYGCTIATCAMCGQAMEYMGRVDQGTLYRDETRCKCDDRCVSARGPHCDCQCGGKNHGSGMQGYVEVAVAVGRPPMIRPANPARYAKALAAWREYETLNARRLDELDRLLARKRTAGWLSADDFARLRHVQKAGFLGNKARTHHARMKPLRALYADALVTA